MDRQLETSYESRNADLFLNMARVQSGSTKPDETRRLSRLGERSLHSRARDSWQPTPYTPDYDETPRNSHRRLSTLSLYRSNSSPSRAQRDGTDSESTVSTRAASTVWDELDDLKTRIRQIELSGTRDVPVTRPVTGTTTMTNLSSPSKHRRPPSSHQRLRDALLHAKGAQPAAAPYLENVATAAISLGEIEPSQVANIAETLCRNLIELCYSISQPSESASSRVMSRLEARSRARQSQQFSSPMYNTAPDLERSSSVVRRRAEIEEPLARSYSRAATDVSTRPSFFSRAPQEDRFSSPRLPAMTPQLQTRNRRDSFFPPLSAQSRHHSPVQSFSSSPLTQHPSFDGGLEQGVRINADRLAGARHRRMTSMAEAKV